MSVKLIESVIYDENNNKRKSYGIKIDGVCYYDLSLDKEKVENFIKLLNQETEPLAHIDILIEDFLS